MRNRMLRAAAAVAAIGFVAACEAPTATVSNNVGPEIVEQSPATPKQAPVAKREAQRIVVLPGRSVSRIAVKYGVSKGAIIAANDLKPPYKIKTGQQLVIPSADGTPAPAAVGSSPPEVISLDRPAVRESTAPTAGPAPASAPDAPVVKPLEVAARAGDKSLELQRAPVVPIAATTGGPPTSSGSAEPSAPITTAAASAPTSVPAAAAPPGVTCPSGTIGMWSIDIIKKPLYICRKSPS